VLARAAVGEAAGPVEPIMRPGVPAQSFGPGEVQLVKIALEVVVGVIVCGVMWRVADVDNGSAPVWAAVTAGLCLASLAVPAPIVRLVVAGVVALAVMFVANVVRPPPP